jgi:predicted transcriptional regulator
MERALSHILRFPDLALGDLERDMLQALWAYGPMAPSDVHERVATDRTISVNTVCSALKRLVEKGLLQREKVSHAYVYRTVVSRADLQRQLIGAIVTQFGADGGQGLLAAFVDLAEERGEDTLRSLERMIAERLEGDDP